LGLDTGAKQLTGLMMVLIICRGGKEENRTPLARGPAESAVHFPMRINKE
jgi:hypothetical protein